ncbi:MAG: acyltransferase family protein [Acidimicrobiia bacterium]|nr:acyltransferase family protein [Acidimicrobiia bacterium]
MSERALEGVPAWSRPLLEYFDHQIADQAERNPFRRKAEVVEEYLSYFRVWVDYFDAEIQGWENLPAEGPYLIVGNHSGGAETNDAVFFLHRWVQEKGPDDPIYVLAYDLLFGMPGIGKTLPALGIVPANPDNARRALDTGAPVMVFPGGDYEVFRPWTHRNLVEFGDHEGFVRVALEAGVPVVPMTIHGAHQSTFIISRGTRLARLVGLDRLRVHEMPIIWNIPFGITPVFVPTVQLPAKVTVHIDQPLDWSSYGSADDPDVVHRCYEEITSLMQCTMDRLERETPHPVASRLGSMASGAGRSLRSLPGRLRGPRR